MMARWKSLWRGLVEEWCFLRRERAVMVILVALPVIYPLVVSWLYQSDQAVERPALVVDGDNSALSRELSLHLDATQELTVVQRIDRLEDGIATLREQRADVLVWIPPGFSQKVKRGEQAEVRLWANTANMYTYGLFYPAVSSVLGDLNQHLGEQHLWTSGVPPQVAAARVMPVQRDERLLFHPTGSYGKFLVLGVLLLVLQQVILVGLGFSTGAQREAGLLDGSERFPFTWLEGKFLAHAGFHVAGTLFMLGVVLPLFHWHLKDAGGVLVLFLLFGLTMFPVAALVASLVRDRMAAFQVLMFLSAPLFLASGFTWPFGEMPRYLQVLAALVPVTPALQALRVLSMKTTGLPALAPYLRWMALQFGAYLVLAVVVVRWRWRALPRPPEPVVVVAAEEQEVILVDEPDPAAA